MHERKGRSPAGPTIVVAIPVCNEVDHIGGCLYALDRQTGPSNDRFGVLLFLNNCRDGTDALVRLLAPMLSFPLRIIVRDAREASAGWARRLAMEAASVWLDEAGVADGILMTSDADSRVPPDWIARNCAALHGGADLVAGCLTLDPDDAAKLPPALLARGAMEAEYGALLDEIGARLDPRAVDPWPTHACHSGASLALWSRTYRDVGGLPDIACGEDRALVAAVLARDGLVRHDPDIVVVTSGRLLGRATGGVADTIRMRCDLPESPCDERLETVARFIVRMRLRRHLRDLHAAGRWAPIERLIERVAPGAERATDPAQRFGALHAQLERASTQLVYRPVSPGALPGQIRRARLWLQFTSAGRDGRRAVIRDRTAAAACG